MKNFKIALVQQHSLLGKKRDNLNKTEYFVNQAVGQEARFICFPEVNLTGHGGHTSLVADAEPVPGGPCTEKLETLAKALNIYICAGIVEDDSGTFYNTQFIVGPAGFIGKQRKVHLSHDEYFYFRAGTRLPVFNLPFARVGIGICADNAFPEVSRCLGVNGAEVMLAPHAARIGTPPSFGKDPKTAAKRRAIIVDTLNMWKKVHECRALDNGFYVCLCNAVGSSLPGNTKINTCHAGGCMVVDPHGNVTVKSKARNFDEEMVVTELKAAPVAARRSATCFNLRLRRPDAYGALSEPTE